MKKKNATKKMPFKEKILSYLGVFSFGIVFQMLFNIPNRSWMDDGKLYAGDRVVISKKHFKEPGLAYAQKFFSQCDYGTVQYVYENDVMVLWHCPLHKDENYRKNFIRTMDTKYLEMLK